MARRMVIVAVLAVFGLTGCWAQFRSDAGHSGNQAFEFSIGAANASQLTSAWTTTTDEAVYSSPAIVNGTAFVGSEDGNVYAVDAAGVTGCSGAPKECVPLWTAAAPYRCVAARQDDCAHGVAQ